MTRRKKPPAYERISVQLPPELVRFLDQRAKADMTTRPTVVRQLVAAAQKGQAAASNAAR
jgi:metal-responsive CopG/Arc/MetJ family transcriptional regulator